MASRKKNSKPQIHSFHDFVSYLNALILYLKKTNSSFSIRKLATQSGLAVGYLSMCLNRKRKFTEKSYVKLRPHLPLTISEKKYLDHLRLASENQDSQTRIVALNELQRIKAYQKSNEAEHEVHRYLKTWLHLAIREMVNEKGFKPDPEYIQSRLVRKVGQAEIRKAWAFLLEKKFVIENQGKFTIAQKVLKCEESIYSLSLAEFHRQMLRMIMSSIDEVPRSQRFISGHTVALGAAEYALAVNYLKEALERIEQLSQSTEPGEKVFHFELAGIPLTKGFSYESK